MKILVVGAGMYVTGRGTGGLGTVLPALAQVSKRADIEEVVVCSRSGSAAADVERAAAEVNRRLGTHLLVRHEPFDSALSTAAATRSIDCAIVSVPDEAHASVGARVLEAGLHCLMVKPFVTSIADARQLIASASSRGLYGAVEFHKRFDEANLVVRRMLGEGSIGALAYATVEYSQRITIPRDVFSAWSARTNIFQYLGVHYVDLLHFMTGAVPRRLTAVGHEGVLSSIGINTFDSVHAIVEWDNPRFTSQFAIGWIDPERSSAMSDQRYVLVGSAGRVECDQKNRGLRHVDARGVADVNPYFSEYQAPAGEPLEFAGYGYRSVERFVLDVADIRGGRVRPADLEGRRPTFTSAAASTAVVEAVGRSLSERGAWKDVDATL